MKHKNLELIKELTNNLTLITEIFILKNDEKTSCDSDTLDVITSAYFNAIFNVLSIYKKSNKNLNKNINEFQNKILETLKDMSFMNVETVKDDKNNAKNN